MIQKITFSSILPYAKVPKTFEGKRVGGYYTNPKDTAGMNVSEKNVAGKKFIQDLDRIVREELCIHDRTPNFSTEGTYMGCAYFTDSYILEELKNANSLIISHLVIKPMANEDVRKHYLDKQVQMPDHSNDMVAGTLQVLASCKNPDHSRKQSSIERLYNKLTKLQSVGKGIVSKDTKKLVIEPYFLDIETIERFVKMYIAFDTPGVFVTVYSDS